MKKLLILILFISSQLSAKTPLEILPRRATLEEIITKQNRINLDIYRLLGNYADAEEVEIDLNKLAALLLKKADKAGHGDEGYLMRTRSSPLYNRTMEDNLILGGNLYSDAYLGIGNVSSPAGYIQISSKVVMCHTFTDEGINAAIDALGASGGEVYLPQGVYAIDGTVYIDYDSTTIRGAGRGTILNLGANEFAIHSNGKDNLVFKDFDIQGNDYSANYTVLSLASSNDCLIENVHISSSGIIGIHIFTTNTQAKRNIVRDCDIEYSGQSGIKIEDSDNSIINCNIRNSIQDGIFITSYATNTIITGCRFIENGGTGYDGIRCQTDNNIISNNYLRGSTGKQRMGILIDANSDNNIVFGNRSYGHDTQDIRIWSTALNNSVFGNITSQSVENLAGLASTTTIIGVTRTTHIQSSTITPNSDGHLAIDCDASGDRVYITHSDTHTTAGVPFVEIYDKRVWTGPSADPRESTLWIGGDSTQGYQWYNLYVKGRALFDYATYFDGDCQLTAGSFRFDDDLLGFWGNHGDFNIYHGLNSTDDDLTVIKPVGHRYATHTSAMFYTGIGGGNLFGPYGMSYYNDYENPTFVIAAQRGADADGYAEGIFGATDFSAVVIGARNIDVSTTVGNYFDFWTHTGAMDDTPNATTTEYPHKFRMGTDTTAVTNHDISDGSLLLSKDLEIHGTLYVDGVIVATNPATVFGDLLKSTNTWTGQNTFTKRVTISTTLALGDNDRIYFGDDDDMYIDYDGAVWNFVGAGANSHVIFKLNQAVGDAFKIEYDVTQIGVASKVFWIKNTAGAANDLLTMDRDGNTIWYGAMSLDATAGDSPGFVLVDGDDKTLIFQKLDAGNATIHNNEGDIVITATGGDITFNDENLTTIGHIAGSSGTFSVLKASSTITPQLRLEYGAAFGVDFDVNINGDMTIDPDGDDLTIGGQLNMPVQAVHSWGINFTDIDTETCLLTKDDTKNSFIVESSENIDFVTNSGLNDYVRIQNNTEIKAVGGNDLTFIDDIAGTLTLSEMSCPPYIYVSSASMNEGDTHLLSTVTWNVDKALIKTARLTTNATNWNMYLMFNDNGYAADDAVMPKIQIMSEGYEDEDIFLDFAYYDEDDSQEVHIYYEDTVGASTATLRFQGYKLR